MVKFRPLAFAFVIFFAAMVGSWGSYKIIAFALLPIGFIARSAGLVCLGAAGANLRNDCGRRRAV